MRAPDLLAERLRDVQRHEAALPAKDAVHDMRVASRRLRAALRILRLRELDPAVKELQDALGAVRDLQLQVEWFARRDAGLRRRRAAELRKAEAALERAVRKWRTRSLPRLLEAASAANGPGSRRLHKMLRKRIRRLEERLEAARAKPTAGAMHRARISVKQVRYLLEISQEMLPAKAAALVADLKTLQASLGELHDVDARLALLRSKPALRRDQQEDRNRLARIIATQLDRWHHQSIASHARRRL